MSKLSIKIINFIGWMCFGFALLFFLAAIHQFWTLPGIFAKLAGFILIMLPSLPFYWFWSITPAGKAYLEK